LPDRQTCRTSLRFSFEFLSYKRIVYSDFPYTIIFMTEGALRENIEGVLARVREAARRAGRAPEEVTLLAVSKTVAPETIKKAYRAGLTYFGESRVQEAINKMQKLTDLDIRWHFIGHLQTNKAKAALRAPFELIHSLDSARLLNEMNKSARTGGKIQKALIEVKLSPEAAKHGVKETELEELLYESTKAENVSVEGLMTIPPYYEDAQRSRPFYARLRELRDEMEGKGYILPVLSMGMSHDFEIAIEEGAGIVRVGTAIFGEREKK
jgi:pyridoxal phosphate enzyme (YggS family)